MTWAPPSACPVCGASRPGPRCGWCGAGEDDPRVQRLVELDRQATSLAAERAALVHDLQPGVPRPDLPPPPLPAAAPLPPPPPAGWDVEAEPAGSLPPPPPGWTSPVARPPSPAPSVHVSTILLGLGVVLLVVAAIVFAALYWTRLGPSGQAVVLVGFTLVAGAGTWAAARRDLPSTAEALGVVTVAMGPILAQAVRTTVDLPTLDEITWDAVGTWSWWPASLVVVGVSALAFGRWVGIRSARWLGVVAVLAGVASWAVIAPLPLVATGVLLAVEAVATAVARARWAPAGSVTGALWSAGAAVLAAASLVWVGVGALVADTAAQRWSAVAVLAAFAGTALAAGARAAAAEQGDAAAAAGAGAMVLAAAALVRAGVGTVPVEAVAPLVGAVGVAVDAGAGAISARSARWRPVARGVRAAAVATVLASALPLLRAVAIVLEAGTWVLDHGWELTATSVAPTPELTAPWAWGLPALAVLAALVAVEPRARPVRSVAWAVVAAAGLLLVPTVAGAPLWAVLAAALAVAVAAALAGARCVDPALRAVAVGVLAVATAAAATWALGSSGLSLVALVAAAATGSAVAVVAARRAEPEACALAATVVVGAALGALAVALVRVGIDGDAVAATVAVAAAAVGAAAVVGVRTPHAARVPLEPGAAPPRPAAAAGWDAVRATAAAAHLAVVGTWYLAEVPSWSSADPVALTVALAAGVVAFAVAAAASDERPVRATGALLAPVEAVALVWLRLGVAGVDWPEAYLLPLAVGLGVLAVLNARASSTPLAQVPSWLLEGPAVAVAVVPTALLSLGDPGVTRQVVALVAGVVLLGVGAAARRRAPVDIGAAVVLVVGAQVLLPYAASVPRWVSLGVAGILLVALGATFEQRRRDVRELRRRYRELQ